MDEVKTIGEHEIETGVFFLDDADSKKKLSKQDFHKLAEEKPFKLVTYKQRIEWLKENGYKLTRENLLNAHLESQPKD